MEEFVKHSVKKVRINKEFTITLVIVEYGVINSYSFFFLYRTILIPFETES